VEAAMARNAKKEKAWLEARRKHVTSTDVACIMGIPGAFASAMDVYLEKQELLAKDEKPKAILEAGIRLQPIILEWYADKLGVAIEHADPYDLVVCAEHPVLAASLDARRLEGDKRPVDAKNVRFRDEQWGEDGSPDFPERYIMQAHVQMLATDTKTFDLAVLFSGCDHGWFTVEEDPERSAAIIEAAESFWKDNVLAGVPPPVDGSSAWTKFLASRKRKLEFEPTPEDRELALQLRDVRRIRCEYEANEETLANQIKALMGDYEVMKGDFGRISFRWSKDRQELDLGMYAAALEMRLRELDPGSDPFIAETLKKHTTTKPGTRSFRPTFKEG
jgi:putative phage-type endonuclease